MRRRPITIWTIGHSVRTSEEFLALLSEHTLRAVADVRRFPGSRRHPQFGQEQLSPVLAAAGIQYLHFPELGGRRVAREDSPNTAWRNEAFRGYADYMMTAPFCEGMDRLIGLVREKPTAIMCAEALWWRCHRALLSDQLKTSGFRVLHILGAGKTEEHPYTAAAHIINGKLSYAAEQHELELGRDSTGSG